VNRCQSYRLGNRNHSNINISTEKTEGSPFSRTVNNMANQLHALAKENLKKAEEPQVEQKEENPKRKTSISKYGLYPKANMLFNQVATSNTPSKSPNPNKTFVDLKKKSGLNTLSFSKKGFLDSKMNVENYHMEKIIGKIEY